MKCWKNDNNVPPFIDYKIFTNDYGFDRKKYDETIRFTTEEDLLCLLSDDQKFALINR